MFRVHHSEAATPRAKANLMRVLLHADDPAKALPPASIREAADLCVNCKMCARECPAHVNIPKLMLEAKAAHAAEHGLDRADWVMARTEGFARLGSAMAPLTNALLGSRVVRWLLEKLLGVSRRRRLPAFAWPSFLRIARRRGWTEKPGGKPGKPAGRDRTGPKRIAYFVDVFANYNDPLLGQSVVEVLHHHGIEVYVPPEQHGSGMAPLACGDVETARERVEANLRVLGDLVREGYTILCSEPTAALMLTRDSLDLVDDPDAHLVAANTVELTAFLWELHEQGRLKPIVDRGPWTGNREDFRSLQDFGSLSGTAHGPRSTVHGLQIGHHVPCHLKALGGPPRGPALLELIPGVRVHTIDVSCSGMAGTFGLRSSGYAASLEAGQPMLRELSRPRLMFGSTECSTCRLQMEEGAHKRTLHPIQYLALAYGLVPALRERLHQPLGDLLLE
jgi:Fe-S oxidoreductase